MPPISQTRAARLRRQFQGKRPPAYTQAGRAQYHDLDRPSTGAIAGTLAGGAVSLAALAWSPPSEWDLKRFPSSAEVRWDIERQSTSRQRRAARLAYQRAATKYPDPEEEE